MKSATEAAALIEHVAKKCPDAAISMVVACHAKFEELGLSRRSCQRRKASGPLEERHHELGADPTQLIGLPSDLVGEVLDLMY